MGQAVVDLPDPMEKPPAAGASADDLLSQLAGDEIDRLLGESDAAAPSADAPAADAAAPAEPVAMVTLMDDALPAAEAPAEPPKASGPLDQTIAAEATERLAEPPAPVEVAPVAAEAVAEATPPVASEPEAVDREALLDPAVEDNSAPASLPLILRPLEWFSAPLDAMSPTARDFLGKAAIVTLVNSAAVIAYVLWFRK